jgi:hypothetical protein
LPPSREARQPTDAIINPAIKPNNHFRIRQR